MKQIEDKEIRGISLKTVRWIIGSTITIVMSLAATYFGLRSQIQAINNKDMLQDLKIKTVEVELQIIKTKLDNMQIQINDNRVDIEKIKSRRAISNS